MRDIYGDANDPTKVTDRRAEYLPINIWPLEGDPIPAGYNGFLIFLDEVNSASLAVQAAAYKIVLDRCVGNRRLHPMASIACAGNLMTDGAIVSRFSTAMQSRMSHFELAVDHKAWSIWASQNHLSPRVIAYINTDPKALHEFDPKHSDKTFPCPRTWEHASRIDLDNSPMDEKLPVLAGTVGQGRGMAFATYTEVFHSIPTYRDIKSNPKGINIPRDPAALAALAGTVGSNLIPADVPIVIDWVHRLPLEFQIFTIRDAVNRNKPLLKLPEIQQWLTTNAQAYA